MNQQHLITPAQPSHTGPTGIPHRLDRSGLCATQIQKSGVSGNIPGVSGTTFSGVSGHLLGVSGLPNPEFPGLYPEFPPECSKPGVSGLIPGVRA